MRKSNWRLLKVLFLVGLLVLIAYLGALLIEAQKDASFIQVALFSIVEVLIIQSVVYLTLPESWKSGILLNLRKIYMYIHNPPVSIEINHNCTFKRPSKIEEFNEFCKSKVIPGISNKTPHTLGGMLHLDIKTKTGDIEITLRPSTIHDPLKSMDSLDDKIHSCMFKINNARPCYRDLPSGISDMNMYLDKAKEPLISKFGGSTADRIMRASVDLEQKLPLAFLNIQKVSALQNSTSIVFTHSGLEIHSSNPTPSTFIKTIKKLIVWGSSQ